MDWNFVFIVFLLLSGKNITRHFEKVKRPFMGTALVFFPEMRQKKDPEDP
jgi:hypothetical protein